MHTNASPLPVCAECSYRSLATCSSSLGAGGVTARCVFLRGNNHKNILFCQKCRAQAFLVFGRCAAVRPRNRLLTPAARWKAALCCGGGCRPISCGQARLFPSPGTASARPPQPRWPTLAPAGSRCAPCSGVAMATGMASAARGRCEPRRAATIVAVGWG